MGFGGGPFFGMDDLSLGQAMFMAEAEGQDDMVDTEEARFNAAINQINEELAWAKGCDAIDVTDEVDSILLQHGISPEDLTYEQRYTIGRTIL